MNSPRHSRPVRNFVSILIGLLTFALGIAWLIYSYLVNREAPYFAIPLVFAVPVIVTVAVRVIWDERG